MYTYTSGIHYELIPYQCVIVPYVKITQNNICGQGLILNLLMAISLRIFKKYIYIYIY